MQPAPHNAPAQPQQIWRNADFVKLWTAAACSQLGTQVTFLAWPLIAITMLAATPLEVSVLQAIGWLPILLLSLPIGVWVDRARRRPILVAADLARAVVLLSIPLAYALGVLSIWQLYAVLFVSGVLTVCFDVADQSYLPSLVAREQLVAGNAALELAQSGTRIAGPSIAGALIGWLMAPIAVVVDACSYIASALLLLSIRTSEAMPAPPTADERRTRTPMRGEIGEGIRFIGQHHLLRPLVTFKFMVNLGWSLIEGLFVLYVVRQLGLEAGAIGLLFTLSNIGLLAAAGVARRLVTRFGLGATILAAAALQGLGVLLVPLAPPTMPLPFLVGGLLVRAFGTVLFTINEVSLRQAVTPPHMRGRVNATSRFVSLGVLPVGYVLGGALATALSMEFVIRLGAALVLLAVVPLLLSPVRSLRTMPQIF